VTFIILLVVFGGLAYRLTSPEERARFLAVAVSFAWRLKVVATEPGPEYDAFREALRARTKHALVTPAIVALNVIVVVGMLVGARAISDPDPLVAWGASLGMRTTNGEWWRLVTSTFVHTGTLHLLVDVAVLIQLGAVLERLAGRLAFSGVYLSAAVFAGLVNLSSRPVAVTTGATAAIFGLYGLLSALLIWQLFRRRREDLAPDAHDSEESKFPSSDVGDIASESRGGDTSVTIPLIAIKRLGAGAVVFLVYSVLNGLAHTAELSGLIVGLAYGLVLARRVGEKEPTTRHVGAAMVATAVIAVACAMPLRNIADVTSEITRVLATEERTAAAYQAAYGAFKKARMTAEALAQLAERTIVPELQASDLRLKALVNVPPEHQALVTDAREYLRLRCASWRARADAIRKANADLREAPGTRDAIRRLHGEARFRSNMTAMGKAEGTERASLEAFQRIRRP
jgi:membrane associated rhomboid family serine protease